MKNVVIVCDYAYIEGGAAKVAIQTAILLAKKSKLNVYFFAGCGEPCKELKESNVNVISLNMFDLLGNPSKINALINGIYNQKVGNEFFKFLSTFDTKETIIHVHTWTKVLSSSVFKVAEKLNITIFLTIHDYFLVCPNGGCFNYVKNNICELKPMSLNCLACNCDVRHYYHKIWRYIRQLKQNSVIRDIDNINYIFISEFQKKQVLKRLPNIQNQYMLRNPITFNDRKRVIAERNKYFIYIGRLSEEKGVKLFCESVNELNCSAVVIGDGKLLDELKDKYPEIIFTGWLQKEEIREWIFKARCLIFPSLWYEGSPLTIPEVQAYGLPCIVTNTNAGVDTIKNNINGEIVNPDKLSICNSIKKMFNDEYIKELSINTFKMFDENANFEDRYIENLLNIYIKGV